MQLWTGRQRGHCNRSHAKSSDEPISRLPHGWKCGGVRRVDQDDHGVVGDVHVDDLALAALIHDEIVDAEVDLRSAGAIDDGREKRAPVDLLQNAGTTPESVAADCERADCAEDNAEPVDLLRWTLSVLARDDPSPAVLLVPCAG